MPALPINVLLVTPPDALCCGAEAWSTAARFIRDRLLRRYPGRINVEQLEAFSSTFYEFPALADALLADSPLPIVMVNGKVVIRGGKLSWRAIDQAIQFALSPSIL